MARADAAPMRAVLRERIAAGLANAEWMPAVPMPGWSFAGFVRPLNHGMSATASVGIASSSPDRLPVLVTHLSVGVGYEPLRRLWPLLGDQYHLTLLGKEVPLPFPEGDEDDEDTWSLRVHDEGDAEWVAETIVALVLRESPGFVAQYPVVDRLLEEFGYEGDEEFEDGRVGALLAAAGRFEEARDALDRYRSRLGSGREDRGARQFVHQLGRYIDSGGDPTLVPSEPPPSEFDRAEPPSMREIWRQSTAREAAVKAVRAMSPDTSRAELRAALERELGARGLTESPLWFERTLDHLHDSPSNSPSQHAELLAKGVVGAAKLALKGIRALREHQPIPDLSPPEWLEPVDRAAFPVPRASQAQWTSVQIDPQARSILDRANAETPRIFGSLVNLEAWLDWNPDSKDQLIVHLGEHKVGALTIDVSDKYRSVMRRAQQRDELPFAPARLTPRLAEAGYLLELQLPR